MLKTLAEKCEQLPLMKTEKSISLHEIHAVHAERRRQFDSMWKFMCTIDHLGLIPKEHELHSGDLLNDDSMWKFMGCPDADFYISLGGDSMVFI